MTQRLGLADFLQDELKRLEDRSGIRIQAQASRVRLPVAVEKALFRIAMEGVNNSIKHAQTQRILVKLIHTQEAVELEIQDWGRGFDPEALVLQRGRHFGIASMKHQADLLGGTCQIISQPGQGTRVAVSVPYPAAQ